MLISNSLRRLLAGIGVLGGMALVSERAQASEEFPAALQEAAGLPCTPSCTVCHGKTPGDAGSFQVRKLARDIVAKGLPLPHRTDQLKASYALYAADVNNKTANDLLKSGVDPQTGDSFCGPTYGCGAHVAKKAPPSDLSAPLWVVGAVVAGGLLRRRRKPSTAS